jgi:hypothetical protein
MLRPHMTALTIELKLSSSSIIAEASRATYVPVMPIANPTSAFFSAGASFVPSPVTATTLPNYLSPVTRAYLSYGRDLPSTSRVWMILLNSSIFLMVSTRTSLLFCSASFGSLSQSQMAVWHLAQTTPPICFMKSGPSITSDSSPSCMIPTSLAMARAVTMLSPVIILTLIPAFRHLAMAPGT